MIKEFSKIVICSLSIFNVACQTSIDDEHKSDVIPQFPDCKVGSQCSAKGVLSFEEFDHVEMGRLDFLNENCVNISFPESRLKTFRRKVGSTITLAGVLYWVPNSGDDSVVAVKVNGRKVGRSECGDTYIFMPNN